MALYGTIDTQYVDFPAGIDRTYLQGLETRSGLSVAAMIAAVDAAMGAINDGVDPLVAELSAPPTTQVSAMGSRGDAFRVQRKSEYSLPRPQQVERRGHMLALASYDVSLGFTDDGLEEISLDAFRENIRAMQLGWERAFRRETLIRLFDAAEVPIDKDQSATSPGFLGSGTGSNTITGYYSNGSAISGSHYVRDTAANRLAAILAQRAKLKLAGILGPYDLVGSQVFIDAVVALGLPNFISAGSELVRVGSGTAEALVDAGRFVGVLAGDIRVRMPVTDFIEDAGVLFKSFGQFAADNPLVMRYDTLWGRQVRVRARSNHYPLSEAVAAAKFGMNVNNRFGGAPILIAAAGAYVAPVMLT